MPPARSKDQTNSALAKGAIDQFAPHWLKPYIEKAKPVFAVIAKGADAAWPYCQKAYALGQQGYTMIEPYGPAELAPMFIGVMMMLFGGYFTILIACVEAYRICGWETTSKSLQIIHENYTNVRDANKKDDEVDEDGNGVADVNEIDEKQLISRKLLLVARTIDPTHISNALSGIYSGFVAVMASLQVVFARTLALGVAIGDVLNKYAVKYLHPIGESVVPPEYHKWIDVVIGYAMKSIGISIAWWLQRIVSAVHSAMRGAQLFTTHFATYTAKRGYTHLSEGYWDEAFSVVCAVFGLYLQLSTAFSMPWFLAILLFPLLAVENVLQWVVSFKIV